MAAAEVAPPVPGARPSDQDDHVIVETLVLGRCHETSGPCADRGSGLLPPDGDSARCGAAEQRQDQSVLHHHYPASSAAPEGGPA